MRIILMTLLWCLLSGNTIVQKKISLDSLNVDQLNLYNDKAQQLEKAGKIVTLSGLGVIMAGLITSAILSGKQHESGEGFDALIPAGIGIMVGVPAAISGTPLWVTGHARKVKAEIALKRFLIKPESSMVIGLGIALKY